MTELEYLAEISGYIKGIFFMVALIAGMVLFKFFSANWGKINARGDD